MVEEMEQKRFEEQLCLALRKIQRRTGCTTKVLEVTLKVLRPFFKRPVSPSCLRRSNRLFFERAGAKMVKLNGCVHCNRFVFTPQDRRHTCPICGHSRYGDDGQAHEVCYYFPIRDQLQVLDFWCSAVHGLAPVHQLFLGRPVRR